METYKITDPTTGNTFNITGDSPPTEAELEQIFSETGETPEIDLPTVSENFVDNPEEMPSIDQRIEDRGTAIFTERFNEWKQSDGLVDPLLKGLSLASTGQEKTEAAIANSMLAVQEGRFDDIVGDFQAGVKGTKLGEIGDVFRNSGVPILQSEPVAATAGFIISMISPLELIGKGNKLLKGLSLKTDKKIMEAGSKLIKGSEDATTVIGRNVDKAYETVNDVGVNGQKFAQSFFDSPPLLVKAVERELGRSFDDIIENGADIATVRKVKQIIGKLKPNSFGKAERGLAENLEVGKINKTYSNVKNLIQDSLTDHGLGKQAKNLIDADEAFFQTSNASDFIRKAITDPTLKLPTKAGNVAKGLITEGNTSTRVALETLKKAGGKAKQNVNKAIDNLNKYNKHLAIQGFIRSAGKAAVFGGAVGAVGGKAASTFINRN